MLPQRNWRDLIKPKKLEAEDKNASASYCKFVGEPFRTRLRHDDRQLPAPRAAVVAAGGGHHRRPYPGGAPRVLDAPRRPRGRRRHHPEPEGSPREAAGRHARHARIEAKGEGEIRAGNIKAGPNVEILNPNQHIATLSKEAAWMSTSRSRRGGVMYRRIETRTSRLPSARSRSTPSFRRSARSTTRSPTPASGNGPTTIA